MFLKFVCFCQNIYRRNLLEYYGNNHIVLSYYHEDASNANETQSPEKDKALFAQYPIDDVKQVFAVRTDLGMTKGKIGAQVGHATLGAYNTTKKWARTSKYWRQSLKTWSYIGQKKICVKATSE